MDSTNGILNSDFLKCRNTINGKCEMGLTQDECKSVCENSNLCEIGQYISSQKNKLSVCFPLYSKIYDNVNPLDNIRFSSFDTSNSIDTVFFNKKWSKNRSGVISSMDHFLLENICDSPKENCLGLVNTIQDDIKSVQFSENGHLPVQFLFQDINAPIGELNYSNEMLAIPIIINIPKTNLILQKSLGIGFEWKSSLSQNIPDNNLFYISRTLKNTESDNKIITWDGEYEIKYKNQKLGIDHDGKLIQHQTGNTVFTFNPQIILYTFKGVSVLSQHVIFDGISAFSETSMEDVFRSRPISSLQDVENESSQSNSNNIIIITLILLICIVITIIIYFLLKLR
ncbi:MAG: hypothetical protein JKX76_00850 [Colwellia sp.]|nr:hypothetical protein [Colwellia sp.]